MRNSDKKFAGVTLALIILLLIAGLVFSCAKPPLPPIQQVKENEKATSTYTTTHNTIDRNKAVADSLKIILGNIRTGQKSCDSLCQEAMDNYLQQINSLKKSGENQYGFLYDKYKKQLTAYANLAETVNKMSVTKTDSIVYQKEYLKVNTPVITNIIPWYYKYPAYFGWACLLFLIGYIAKKVKSWLTPTLGLL